jgi:hypothetical protein
MEERLIEAVLKAWKHAKVFTVDGLSDKTPIQMLVVCRLGDLRELELSQPKRAAPDDNVTIFSGG